MRNDRLTREQLLDVMERVATGGFECKARCWAANDGRILWEIAVCGRLQSFDGDGGYHGATIDYIEKVVQVAKDAGLELWLGGATVGEWDAGDFELRLPSVTAAESTVPSGFQL